VNQKSRLVPSILIGGLVLAGGGSVLAAAGGSASKDSSSQQQYCPPNSPGGGQPQGGPNNNCGKPPDNCPNGKPKPPDGNCGNGNPNGPPEKHKKKHHAKLTIHRHPRRGCIQRTFAARIGVVNKQSGRKVTVYRDGHRIGSSTKRAFKVHFSVLHLSRGVHVLKVRVRGSDGKVVTKTVRFKRC
jgi:hypothetical protein